MPAAPESSLLVRKATNAIPHGGGRRIAPDSRAAQVLTDWIRQGMPGPRRDEPQIIRVEITPAQQTLTIGQSVQLAVVAHYADGRQRDVTWLTQFASRDTAMLEVNDQGTAQARRHGETVVTAAFRGLIEVATFTVQYEDPVDPGLYVLRNNPIDDAVYGKLGHLNIEPSALCDDATFLRRASLDVLGVLPAPQQVREFVADTRPDKRERLVESLLERPEFVDYWAHWLGDLLQNRRERDHDVRGVKGVRSFHQWLRRQVAEDRSWKEIATDVLAATGSVAESPAVGYFIVTVGERESHDSELADSVAQAFLGTRIGCARCHNHPLEKSTQDDYYHFVAFFSRVQMDRQKPEERATSLQIGTRQQYNVERQIAQEQPKLETLKAAGTDAAAIADLQSRLVEWQRQAQSESQSPVQVRQPRTGQQLAPRPLDRSNVTIPPGSDPRQAFITWMTAPSNTLFSGAMVNRLWRHFLGSGLVEPVDDLRATNPPSNLQLWDVLNREFLSSGTQLKPLMRLILNSRTYQLSSETTASNFRDQRFYSHFTARRLPAEVLLDAICDSTAQPETFSGYPVGVRSVQVPDPFTDSYFLTLFGRSARTTACACERSEDVTLPQLLHLQNGESLHEKIRAPDGRLAQILTTFPDDAAAIDELFLATLSRLPTAQERTEILGTLAGADRTEAMADLLWALLNSKEFTFNH